MEKEKFLELFSKESEKEALKLYNYFDLSRKYDLNIFTDEFFTPNLWRKLGDKISGIHVLTKGLTEESDRRQVLFAPELSGAESLIFPSRYIRIKNMSKFKEQEHKDYLGSILGLNIKRDLFGDIMVYENGAYMIISEKIADYVANNLKQIGKTPCEVEFIENFKEIPEPEFDEIMIRVSTERLDSVVSELINMSRGSASEGIESGNVMLNYAVQKKKDKHMVLFDIITIRKHGKYIFSEDLGYSKKGKRKLLFKKYI